MTVFADFLEQHRQKAEPLEREAGDAWWQSNLDASETNEARAADAQKALTRLYANREAFAFLREVDKTVLTPDEARQHTLLFNTYTGNQMDDVVIVEMVDTERRVESAYNNFRPLLRGEVVSDNTLRDILRTSDDAILRREAWEASKEVGREVEADVLRLVTLRNTEAKRLGYSDYYTMALALQEIEPDTLFALLEDIAAQTQPVWDAYKTDLDQHLAARFGITTDGLRPWHYSDPFFQEAPPGDIDLDRFFANHNLETLTRDFFAAIGLNVQDILDRSDLYERDGKCQHAFCIHVGRYDDVRVLCNCTPSERWMGTLLHEFGHAVYDKYLGEDLPFFLRDTAHTLTTEAIAMLMGRLSRNAAWLETYAGVAPDEARAIAASAREEQRVQLLLMARWCLVMAHFEREMYRDPSQAQDLNELWWETVARFQNINAPGDNRDAPDWAAKLHLALAPVYYHNYLMGEMLASQLLDYLRANVLPEGATDAELVASPAVGAYLSRAIFAPGARHPWNDLITSATGEPLSPAHFVAHLSL